MFADEPTNITMDVAAEIATKMLGHCTRVETLLGQYESGNLKAPRMTIGSWAKSIGDEEIVICLGLAPDQQGNNEIVRRLFESRISNVVYAGLILGDERYLPKKSRISADKIMRAAYLDTKVRLEVARRMHRRLIEIKLAFLAWLDDPVNAGKGYEDWALEFFDSSADFFADLVSLN